MGPLDYVTLTLTAGQVLGKNWENLEWGGTGEQENKRMGCHNLLIKLQQTPQNTT